MANCFREALPVPKAFCLLYRILAAPFYGFTRRLSVCHIQYSTAIAFLPPAGNPGTAGWKRIWVFSIPAPSSGCSDAALWHPSGRQGVFSI